MRLSDVKIGDKFYFLNDSVAYRMYIRIDMDLKALFPTLDRQYRDFSNLIPALDLTNYKICCFSGSYEVEVEYDNVFI